MRLISNRHRLSIALVLIALQWLLLQSSLIAPANTFLLDMLFTLRGERSPPEEVMIVAIDEPSFSELGLQWPWPRSLHAKLIDKLSEAGAQTVVLDILFSEPSKPSQDEALGMAISQMGNVVLTADQQTITERSFIHTIDVQPLTQFSSAATGVGLGTLPVDSDGRVRHVQLEFGGHPLLAYVGAKAHAINTCCKSSDTYTSQKGLINYYGSPRTIRTVSYYQALNPSDYLPDDIFKNKIIFIGLSLQNAVDTESPRPDHYPTALTLFGGEYLSGVEIQATIAANLINNDYLIYIDRYISQSAGIALALAGLMLFSLINNGTINFFIIINALITAIACYLFIKNNITLNIIDIALAPSLISFHQMVHNHYNALLEKNHIRKLFSLYLAPDIIKEIEQKPNQFNDSGEIKTASVMFLDIAGYTRMAENMPPEELLKKLNHTLGSIANIIIENEGLVDKYIGDAVMAVWGAPVEQKNHAINACNAALTLEHLLKVLNKNGLFSTGIDFRIGINSGVVIAGSVGGENHRNYTVLGDNVNLASRLESANKKFGTRIIISQSTAKMIADQDFVIRELERVIVAGKSKSVTIYELVGHPDNISTEHHCLIENYRTALALYRKQEWQLAIDRLQPQSHIDPPSLFLLARCDKNKQTSPSDQWNSDVSLDSK